MDLAGGSGRSLRLRRLTIPAISVVVALLAGACSGDDTTADASEATATSTSASPGSSGGSSTGPTTGVAPATGPSATSAPAPTSAPPPTPLENIDIRLRRVATMNSPIAMATRRDRREIWVAERAGRVRVFDPVTAAVSEPIVDISSNVSTGGERGLLGIAFSPDGNKLYLSYTNNQGDSRIDEFTMNRDTVDTGSRRTVLALDQPFANHNGGNIVFGPDGYLWIGFGDGGSQGDPRNNGQNVNALLGSILRIDPGARGNGEYGIPADNPFAGGGGLPEIWLKGTRNPWRFSFDRATGDLWIADVGGTLREEIDVLPAASGRGRGANLEWALREGTQQQKGARPPGGVAPVHEYSHAGGNCSITGGHVYRGSAFPALQGVYVYGDYCVAELRIFRLSGASGQDRLTGVFVDGGQLGSFGEGPDGELYALSLAGGIYHLQPA
jgi:glucose/arabinose dehydrogenase